MVTKGPGKIHMDPDLLPEKSGDKTAVNDTNRDSNLLIQVPEDSKDESTIN